MDSTFSDGTEQIWAFFYDAITLVFPCEKETSFDRTVTGDDKLMVYINGRRKQSWKPASAYAETVAKMGLYPMKMLLSLHLDCRGFSHFELFPFGKTISIRSNTINPSISKQIFMKKRSTFVNKKGSISLLVNTRQHF